MVKRALTKLKVQPSNPLELLSTDTFKPTTLLALLLFDTPADSPIVQTILLTIEYAQLVSLMIFLYPNIESDQYVQSSLLLQAIIYVAKLINPGYLLHFTKYTRAVGFVLTLTAVMMLLKYIHYLRLLVMTRYNLPIPGWDTRLWKFIFNIQNRLLFSVCTSVWFSTIRASIQSGFSFFQLGFVSTIIFSTVMITLEYIFSMHLLLTYCYVLPSEAHLSSKNSLLQFASLTHKLALQVLVTMLTSIPYSRWIIISFNLCLCCAQCLYFVRFLPLYKVTALLWQAALMTCTTSLAFIQLIQQIVLTASGVSNAGALFVWWILLSLLSTVMIISHVKTLITYIATDTSMDHRPDVLVHRISLIREMRKHHAHSCDSYKCRSVWRLELQTIIKNIRNTTADADLPLDPDIIKQQSQDIQYKLLTNQWSLHFLETLCTKYPKSGLVKAYLIYFYLKKFRLHWRAAKIVKDLKQVNERSIRMTVSVLTVQNRSVLPTEAKDHILTALELATFIGHQSMLERLKDDMLQQAQQQITLCHELTNGSSDLTKLLQYGASITICRTRISHNITLFTQQSPECFFEPHLMFAEYHLTLNHSLAEYAVHRRHYAYRCYKYNKHFAKPTFSPHNLYHNANALIIVSGQKSSSGNIVFCNRAMTDMFGGDAQLYIGRHMSSLAVGSLQSLYTRMFREIIEHDDKSSLDTIKHFYGTDKDGYLLKTELAVAVHPNLSQGLFLIIVLRPSVSGSDALLVDKNGYMESWTKKVAADLSLGKPDLSKKKEDYNVKHLSKDLERAIQAFSMTTAQAIKGEDNNKQIQLIANSATLKKSISNMMIIDDAHEVCASFTGDGRNISLTPLQHTTYQILQNRNDNNSIEECNYYYKISTFSSGAVDLQLLIMLRRLDLSNAYDTQTIPANYNRSHIKSSQNPEDIKPLDAAFDNLKTEHEDQSGWIDFQHLTSNHLPQFGQPQSSQKSKQTEHHTNAQSYNHLTLRNGESSLVTHTEKLITPQSALNTRRQRHQQQPPLNDLNTPIRHLIRIDNKIQDTGKLDLRKVMKCSKFFEEAKNPGQLSTTAGRTSKSSQKRISSAFKAALNIKFQPKNLQIITYIFLAVMMFILIIQLVLRTELNSNYTSLGTQNDIVIESQYRTYSLIFVVYSARITYDYLQGYIGGMDFGRLSIPIDIQNTFSIYWTQMLSEYNQKVITSTFSLDQNSRAQLFKADVNMYDTSYEDAVQTYITINNFAATSEIVERAFNSLDKAYANISIKSEYMWLFRNAVNDLLIKNEEVAEVFSDAVDSRKKEIALSSYICSSLMFTLLLLVLIGMSVTIGRVYLEEKRNLMAITKLDTHDVCTQINVFKALLESGDRFSDELAIRDQNPPQVPRSRNEDKVRSKRMTTFYEPDTKAIRIRYLFYIAKACLFFFVIALLVMWQILSIKDSITTLSTYQNQLYYINSMRIEFILSNMALKELLSADSVKTIENIPLIDKVNELSNDLAAGGGEVAGMLSGSYGKYEGAIREVLYGDICTAVLDYGMTATSACQLAALFPINRGLIRLLAVYQSVLADKIRRYEASDKSFSSLKAIKIDDYDVDETQFFLLTVGVTKLSDCLDSIFQDELLRTISVRNMMLILFFVIVTAMSLATWLFVLRPVRSSDTQIKQILQAFPPELVLRNHLLKMFLLKTSKGTLDYVRNEI